ncbi:MAG: ornithine carbamoyltransferase, partial [Deltaproteobacteria bacterium]|nr:ornithine carbamoyltransferase [Deltaproteobacteria bacterium]
MNLLKISDLEKAALDALIDRAVILKARSGKGIPHTPLKGKTLALVFEKPSTRTRLYFESALYQLVGNALFISTADSQKGRGEPVKD